jgi:hypothetical protein
MQFITHVAMVELGLGTWDRDRDRQHFYRLIAAPSKEVAKDRAIELALKDMRDKKVRYQPPYDKLDVRFVGEAKEES